MHFTSPTIDTVGADERADRFTKRSIKKEAKLQALKLALSMIDLTTLEGADTPGKVRQLCRKAITPYAAQPDLPRPAAICVYPTLVETAKRALEGTDIKVAAVATAFPAGQAPLDVKLADTRFAAEAGADEIDMVISRGKFLAGEYEAVADEIRAVKEVCGEAHLKVILETGELKTYDNVRRASDLAIAAGADFIKTSTGKVKPAATLPVTIIMLQAIRDHYDRTGEKVGMKPAGGIATAKQAIAYLAAVHEITGSDWLTPALFRFGASRLANDLLMQIVKQQTGAYQSADYFSID